MSKKEEHGLRNQALSIELLNGKVYYDWVVTTSFYAVIHYIEDILLPAIVNNITCNNISEVRKAYKMKGRHESRERLVCDNTNLAIAVKYKWLDDRSRYSRYTTYRVTPAEAAKATQYVEEIFAFCEEIKK